MNKELELWNFIAERLKRGETVMLLVVAESSGSSPGRQGYKMAVGSDGELCGSIGGGVMEVDLVEQSRAALSVPPAPTGGLTSFTKEQIHRDNVPAASGMICSGKQTVVFRLLTPEHREAVDKIINSGGVIFLEISHNDFRVLAGENTRVNGRANLQKPARSKGEQLLKDGTPGFQFKKISENEFIYTEKLGHKNDLYIIGGGHCALALSELMAKLDFRISIFDDRADLNTIAKNRFAHEIKIIESYEMIADEIFEGPNVYVVVMTLGYASDELVIRRLLAKNFKYFGVLGSRAKMATLMRALREDGLNPDRLAKIHTPIGLPINSQTPEEIAISIAAEIISIKNADPNP